MRLASFLSAQTGENMRKISFNDNWECCPVDCQDQKMEINLPFDAMLLDDKKEDCAGGVNIGWIDARDYIFEKNFTAPEEWKEREVIFEFEGVYQTASVYINGTKVESHSYGYTGFYINAGQWIRYGENNTNMCPGYEQQPAQQPLVYRHRDLSAGMALCAPQSVYLYGWNQNNNCRCRKAKD